MTKWDQQYYDLTKRILEEGVHQENRTGIDTIKIPSHYLHFDLKEEFPVLTTKQLFFRQAILEMLWIYQVQSNDVRWLQDRNVHIWDEWEVDENGYWNAIQRVRQEDGSFENEAIHRYIGKEYAHTIGTAYGYIVSELKLMDRLLDDLKNHPEDRRMVMSLWQDDYLKTAVLPSCVWSSEWDVTNGKLNAWVHQRSCDVPLGLPFNVTQYAVLLNLLAKVNNLEPGTLDWSIKNAHIYENQIDGIREQMRRFEMDGGYEAPELWLNPEIESFYDFDHSKDCKDIKIKNYKHMGPIRFPLAQ